VLGVRKKSIVSATQLDNLLLDRIKVRFFNSDRLKNVLCILKDKLSEQSKNRSIAVEEIGKSIADIDKKIDAVLDCLDPKHRDLINKKIEELTSDKERLAAKKEELLSSKLDLDVDKVAQEILDCAEDFDKVLSKGTPSEKKEILRSYVGKIFIDTDIKQAKVGFYPLPKTPVTEPLLLEYAGIMKQNSAGGINIEEQLYLIMKNYGYVPILEQRSGIDRYPLKTHGRVERRYNE
jgi:hypothetical protein